MKSPRPIKLLIAFGVCLAILQGCGDLDVARLGQSPTPSPEQAEVVQVPEDAVTRASNSNFDGTRAIAASLPKLVPEFAISVRLKPAGPAPAPVVYADATPPQPFLAGSIAATQSGNSILISNVTLTYVTKTTSILIVSQFEGPVKVYRDNELVGEAVPAGPIKEIVLGRGYNERYWTGEIEEFKIFDLDGAATAVGPENVFDYQVIYDLHGAP